MLRKTRLLVRIRSDFNLKKLPPKNNEGAGMFIITKEYKYFKLFFAKLEKKFTGSSSSFTHIYHIIIALACLSRPKTTENIVAMFNTPYSRQALEKFFNNSECDFEGLLMNSAFITLRKLGWKNTNLSSSSLTIPK